MKAAPAEDTGRTMDAGASLKALEPAPCGGFGPTAETTVSQPNTLQTASCPLSSNHAPHPPQESKIPESPTHSGLGGKRHQALPTLEV